MKDKAERECGNSGKNADALEMRVRLPLEVNK
jgi:hypothetical protein